ncbi:hypothetical protein JTB14_017014 [Gonioctena quinquepunctata]|nr:hypothetical protein JTB14_017014 [Gonioctena quinquepunctata]
MADVTAPGKSGSKRTNIRDMKRSTEDQMIALAFFQFEEEPYQDGDEWSDAEVEEDFDENAEENDSTRCVSEPSANEPIVK